MQCEVISARLPSFGISSHIPFEILEHLGENQAEVHQPRPRNSLPTPLRYGLRRNLADLGDGRSSTETVDYGLGVVITHGQQCKHACGSIASDIVTTLTERRGKLAFMKMPGERIRECRTRLKWSQQKLADKVGQLLGEKLSRAAVAQWELGGGMRPENVLACAELFEVSARWIVFGKEDPDTSDRNSTPMPAGPTAAERTAEYAVLVTSPVPPAMQSNAPISTEQLMTGDIPRTQFSWTAEDDEMLGGDIPVRKGYKVVIEPRAIPLPGQTVLVQIDDRRPVLRRISDSGAAWFLVTETSGLPPQELVPGRYHIIGVMRTAYPEMVPVQLQDEEPVAAPRRSGNPTYSSPTASVYSEHGKHRSEKPLPTQNKSGTRGKKGAS